MSDQKVACPHCFQMNHYNAEKCAFCLGDTWRANEGHSDDGIFVYLMMLIAFFVWAFKQ